MWNRGDYDTIHIPRVNNSLLSSLGQFCIQYNTFFLGPFLVCSSFFLLEKQKNNVCLRIYSLYSFFVVFCYRFFCSKQGTNGFCRYGKLFLEDVYVPWELHLWFCKSCISEVFESGVRLSCFFFFKYAFSKSPQSWSDIPLSETKGEIQPRPG